MWSDHVATFISDLTLWYSTEIMENPVIEMYLYCNSKVSRIFSIIKENAVVFLVLGKSNRSRIDVFSSQQAY